MACACIRGFEGVGCGLLMVRSMLGSRSETIGSATHMVLEPGSASVRNWFEKHRDLVGECLRHCGNPLASLSSPPPRRPTILLPRSFHPRHFPLTRKLARLCSTHHAWGACSDASQTSGSPDRHPHPATRKTRRMLACFAIL